jgi:hypothetical protein
MRVPTDEGWSALRAGLGAVRSGAGRRFRDGRRTVEGVLWRLGNGARRRAAPAESGPWWRGRRGSASGGPGRGFGRGRSSGRATRAGPGRAGPGRARCSWTARRPARARRRPAGEGARRRRARPLPRRVRDEALRRARRERPAARSPSRCSRAGPGRRAGRRARAARRGDRARHRRARPRALARSVALRRPGARGRAGRASAPGAQGRPRTRPRRSPPPAPRREHVGATEGAARGRRPPRGDRGQLPGGPPARRRLRVVA